MKNIFANFVYLLAVIAIQMKHTTFHTTQIKMTPYRVMFMCSYCCNWQ